MTKAEKKYVGSLYDVADECGLDSEEIDPDVLEDEFDAARAGEDWPDAHVHMLVMAFDKGWTPEQVKAYAIKEGIWTAEDEDDVTMKKTFSTKDPNKKHKLSDDERKAIFDALSNAQDYTGSLREIAVELLDYDSDVEKIGIRLQDEDDAPEPAIKLVAAAVVEWRKKKKGSGR